MGRRAGAPPARGGEGEDFDGDLETPAAGGGRDDPALRSEVAQLLGSLGLPTGAGNGSGFDDRDFRPPAAAKEARAARRGGERDAPAAPAVREPRQRGGGAVGKRSVAAAAEDGGGEEAAPRAPQHNRKGRREWAFGAGPAPEPPALDAPLPGGGGARERTGVWFVDAASLPPLPPPPRGAPQPDVSALRAEGATALAAEEAAGGRGGRTSAEAAWLRVVRTAGTGADRVAAATVQAQRDPLAHGRALDSLLEMCAGARAAGGKRAAGQALDALRELFALHLLPDRKLRRFEEQPLAAAAALRPGDERRAAHLLYWHFEASLKAKFARFVEALLELSRDPLEWLKERAVAAAAALLRAKPEGEAPLLRLLVNKLGDPGRKAASAAAYQLAQLLAAHPAMKGVVVREVGHFAFRPRIGLRAQYTAVVFVSQLALSHRGSDPAVAEQMITLYFDLFQALLAAPAEAGAAADGAFRGKGSPAAGVAAKAKGKAGGKGAKKPGKGSGPKKKGGDASAGPDAVADASVGVDSRLLRALLTGINRALPYVPAEAVDALVERVAPAVYRIAHGPSLGAACQALALLYQMMASRAAASDRFYRALYDALLAPALPRSASAAMFLSLLFRAARADVNPKRVAAIIKRLLQVACVAPAPFACGALLLTSEVLREQPALWAAALQAEEGDGEERFEDAPLPPSDDEDGDDAADPDAARRRERAERNKLSARFELSDSDDEDAKRGRAAPEAVADDAGAPASAQPSRPGGGLGRALPGGYDMAKRDPQHSGAERAGLWELALLAAHMHPSVAAMARSLLAGAHVSYDGDPLRDMALAAFLDRWLQKKPKAAKVAADAAARMGRRSAAGEAAGKAAPGSAEFAALMEEDVDPSDVFFHRYFAAVAAKAKAEARARRRHHGGGSDSDGDGDGDGSDDDEPDAAWAARRAAAARGSDEEDEFGGDSDSELDAALEAAEREELGGDADDGHDYADLAAAMQGGSSDEGDPSESESDGDDADDDAPAARKRKADNRPGSGMSVFADAEDFEEALAAGGVERPDGGSDASSEGDDVAEYDDSDDSDGGRFLEPRSDDSDSGEEEPPAKAAKKKAARPARAAPPGAGKARRGKRSTGARAVRNSGAEKRKLSKPAPAAEAKQAAKKPRKY